MQNGLSLLLCAISLLGLILLLCRREGVLDSEINWEDECSLGEKQRLAIARLVYHKPRFAILDECTSAVSSEMEREMYRICRNNKITYITISHRPALMAFHERILTIGDGKCGFTLNDVDHTKIPQKEVALAMSSVKADVDQNAEQKIAESLDARSVPYQHLESRTDKEIKDASTFSRFRRLLKISMGGSGTPKVVIIGVCIVIEQFLRFWHQSITGEMFAVLMNQARHRVPSIMFQSTAASLCLATVQLCTRFTSQRLEVTMSEQLTGSLLSRYISGDMFYKMASLDKRIKDPDQRIAEDIKSFCESTTGMFAEVISPIVQVRPPAVSHLPQLLFVPGSFADIFLCRITDRVLRRCRRADARQVGTDRNGRILRCRDRHAAGDNA